MNGREGRGTYCFLISSICDPCNLSLNNGSLIIAGAGVARGWTSISNRKLRDGLELGLTSSGIS